MCGSGVSGPCPALLGDEASSSLNRSLAACASAMSGPAADAGSTAALTSASGLGGACSSATAWKALSKPGPCGEPPPPARAASLPAAARLGWRTAEAGRHSARRRAAERAASGPRARPSERGAELDDSTDVGALLAGVPAVRPEAGVADRLAAALPSGDAGPLGSNAECCSRAAREHQCAARSAATSASRCTVQGWEAQIGSQLLTASLHWMREAPSSATAQVGNQQAANGSSRTAWPAPAHRLPVSALAPALPAAAPAPPQHLPAAPAALPPTLAAPGAARPAVTAGKAWVVGGMWATS